jgi:hypothetical protein
MDTLTFVLDKYKLSRFQESPIKLMISRYGSFPRLFNQLGFTVGAEIGVEKGKFSEHLCQHCPNLKLYGIDAWTMFDGYDDVRSQNAMEENKKAAKKRLIGHNCQIVEDWSKNVVKRFADESLDFVYIDAGHDYENANHDIREWSKKVRKGGIVAGHDYKRADKGIRFSVMEALDEHIKEQDIKPLFLNQKDGDSTWWYVKYNGYTRRDKKQLWEPK